MSKEHAVQIEFPIKWLGKEGHDRFSAIDGGNYLMCKDTGQMYQFIGFGKNSKEEIISVRFTPVSDWSSSGMVH